MIDYSIFATLILNALVIIGFNRITEYGLDVNRKPVDKELLWFVQWYSRKWIGEWWSKPICTCPVCMSSLHSLYVFWFAYDFTLYNLYLYALYVLALAGICTVYGRFFEE